tara:strand:+ start:287 stop:1108 length:822 start_codon:yes stop_codon:yes gene_type:complete
VERTGVAHGLAANAKVAPATKDVKKGGRFNDLGSKLVANEGNWSWTSPSKFNPMTMAKMATEIGATTPICPNAFPAVAAKTPNKANAEANPTAKAIAFVRIAVFFASSSFSSSSFINAASDAYPPMYPNVNGNTDNVHGDTLVTSPAINTNTKVAGDVADVTLNALAPSFDVSKAPETNPSNPDVTSNSDFETSATHAISRHSKSIIIIIVPLTTVVVGGRFRVASRRGKEQRRFFAQSVVGPSLDERHKDDVVDDAIIALADAIAHIRGIAR